MRAHMAALENAPMVSRFHQLEQSVERENLGGVDRFLSFGYKILSNYGSSSGKPLVWLLSLLLVTFFLALLDGGSASGELTGWQTSLQGEEWQAQVERAASLALQATLNPLGIFGTKGAVVAKSGWLACWLFVHGVFSALFIALLILAVRRRFKVG